ncbi:putative disease resistance protein At3g14460 isoform X2 [Mangifera indica]|uniref:putative disease resistance protein At3g14460 isoform X2 n=1 Tax=Mangifera indica TaxID=29780 RepID=UPI001CF9D74C|nr:putative disease resistance protein At3g14460 isoform X2 [Mangifera indica]
MEVVLQPVVSELVNRLFKILGSNEVQDFARQLVGGVDSEIKDLKDKLRLIGNLLGKMEDMQLSDDSVKIWFDNLQHWAYDAEDLLDEFAYEALRRKCKAEHQASSSGRFSFLPASLPSPLFAVQMRTKIKKINSRFEQHYQQILKERQLLELPGLPSNNVAALQKPGETSCVPPQQKVYGRNEDEAELLKMVKSGANFQVIAVVGMAGIGKTTIAREVYNHKELEDFKFEKKAWVCVSTTTTFDVLEISKALLVEFKSSVPNNLNAVQVRLKEKVSGKKFLIVLDDIWKVRDIEWETLTSPFEAGAPGSTMIVTTRDTGVPQTIRCPHTYPLKFLSNEACESLFKEHAFGTGAAAVPNQISDSIYKKVVERCEGLPLAAKTLGGLLRFEQSGTWENILESNIWSTFDERNHILPSLKLSYHYLPPNLKRCFGYCAIFPQDYKFEEKELALLWIAEGIVQPSNKQLDEASECFHKLCSRSLFQQFSSDSSKYVMHDCVHELAQLVFKRISFRSKQNIIELPEKVRYFTYEPGYYNGKNKFEALEKAKSLRTFLSVRPLSKCYISATVIFDLLPKFEMLRTLSFEGYQIIYLPDSIGDMIHLRYLNFSHTKIRSLPESICQLFNLQTLLLKDCFDLMELPSNMRYLTNLCHLDISGQNSLREMPYGMKELKNLQVLSNFIVGEDKRSYLEDLRSLSFLQGELHISGLQNVTGSNQIPGQMLSNMSKLKVLLLEWGHQVNSQATNVEMNLLDKLKPPINLRELTIRGYGGKSFPSWLGDWSWLSNLVALKLEECKSCTSLPSLEMLSSLEDLTIKKMASLKRIDFRTPFKSLKFLHFKDLEEWEHWDDWRGNEDTEIYPKLRVLSIVRCPQLIGKVSNRLSSLERFVIKDCPKLVVSFSNYPIHCKLEIDGCEGTVCNDGSIDFENLYSEYFANILTVEDKLKEGSQRVYRLRISRNEEIMKSWQSLGNTNFLSNINSLEICACHNLRSIERGMLPSSLKEFHINFWQRLTFIDSDALPLSLKRLRIDICEELKFLKNLSVCSLIESIDVSWCKSLKWISLDGPLPETLNQLYVRDCKALETLSSRRNEYLPKALTSIDIRDCKELKSIGLHHLPCLESIVIWECPKLSAREGVPTSLRQLLINECEDGKGMGMLASLKELSIWDLPQLKSISDLTNLTSLKHLNIWELPQLELIPNLSGLTSLQKLKIDGLPQLESIQDLSNLTSLEDLEISECPRIKSIPSLSGLTSLPKLKIADLPQLESIQDLSNLTSLTDFRISECPRIKSIPNLSGLTCLQNLEIADLPQLESIQDLSNLTSLEDLQISKCPRIKSIPSLSCLTSLQKLTIFDLPQLESIQDLSNLTSLEHLQISKCPSLISIPHLSSLTSLQSLHVTDCPLLIKRWKSVAGKYSSKIAQIPEVVIDGKFIYNSKEYEVDRWSGFF